MQYDTLGIQVTNRCNMTCEHCITSSGPREDGELGWDDIEPAIRGAAPYVDGVCVTGGEPLLRRELTLAIIRLTRELGLVASIVTNGSWARSPSAAQQTVADLADAGLDRLAVSYDRFHNSRLTNRTVLAQLLEAASAASLEAQVQYCGSRDDDAYRIAEEVTTAHGARLTTAEVLPFGRGLHLVSPGQARLDDVPNMPCEVARRPVLTPERELFTCCGPARGATSESPLRLATNEPETTGDALKSGAVDPVLNAIHAQGPHALVEHLSSEARERIATRLRDSSICSLCRAITDDEHALAEVQSALSPDRHRLLALSAIQTQRWNAAQHKDAGTGECS